MQNNGDSEQVYTYNAIQFDSNIDEVGQVVEATTGYYAHDSGSDNDMVEEENMDSNEASVN